MAFTGKCTYTAGTTLPEVAEDVGDLVSILSPHETPLLDALGDPLHAATSTRYEWLDDELLPNFDVIAQPVRFLVIHFIIHCDLADRRFRAADLHRRRKDLRVIAVPRPDGEARRVCVRPFQRRVADDL